MLGPTRAATTLPLFLPQSPPDQASGLIDARPCWRSCWGKARPRPDPGAGRSTAARCTTATEAAFGDTDAEGR